VGQTLCTMIGSGCMSASKWSMMMSRNLLWCSTCWWSRWSTGVDPGTCLLHRSCGCSSRLASSSWRRFANDSSFLTTLLYLQHKHITQQFTAMHGLISTWRSVVVMHWPRSTKLLYNLDCRSAGKPSQCATSHQRQLSLLPSMEC